MQVVEPTPGAAEGLIPYLPAILAVLVVVIPIIGTRINQRRGAEESRVPTMPQVWAESRELRKELEAERRFRRYFQRLIEKLGSALASMSARHPMTTIEQKALNEYDEYLKSDFEERIEP